MRALLALILMATLLGACSTDDTLSGPPPTTAAPEVTLPDGWRWESYRGVEVAVPGDWGSANASQRIGQWCVEPRADQAPAVGRPGASTLVACGIEENPPAETLIENTGPIVAFADAVTEDGTPLPVARGGDREVVRVRDVYVIVQVPQPLRDQIAATVRVADDVQPGDLG